MDVGPMNIHYVFFRAIAHATEDEDRVGEAMRFVSGAEEPGKECVEGHFGNHIIIMEATIRKNRTIKSLFERLDDSDILETLLAELEERMDEDCVFHFRLDKQQAYAGKLALAKGKDVIDCSVKVAAYPARRDRALAVMAEGIGDIRVHR